MASFHLHQNHHHHPYYHYHLFNSFHPSFLRHKNLLLLPFLMCLHLSLYHSLYFYLLNQNQYHLVISIHCFNLLFSTIPPWKNFIMLFYLSPIIFSYPYWIITFVSLFNYSKDYLYLNLIISFNFYYLLVFEDVFLTSVNYIKFRFLIDLL